MHKAALFPDIILSERARDSLRGTFTANLPLLITPEDHPSRFNPQRNIKEFSSLLLQARSYPQSILRTQTRPTQLLPSCRHPLQLRSARPIKHRVPHIATVDFRAQVFKVVVVSSHIRLGLILLDRGFHPAIFYDRSRRKASA